MKEKGPFLASVQGKCPHCRKGDIFNRSPLSLFWDFKMNENCPHCGIKFEREPGFFYGAMYMSYAFSVGVFLVVSFVLYFIFSNPSLTFYIIAIVSTNLLIIPVSFRLSRSFFLYLFGNIKYQKQ